MHPDLKLNSKFLTHSDYYNDHRKGTYLAAYRLWKKVWDETFRELTGDADCFSDDFLKSNEVLILELEDQIVGVFLLSWLDLSNEVIRGRRYFKTYPKEIIDRLLLEDHSNIMTMGYLTVHPEWRKSKVGPLVSEVLLGLATKRFLSSRATALIAYTRNNRKVNELVYRHGAIPLKQGGREHNVEIDVISIFRSGVRPTSVPDIAGVVDFLWSLNHLNSIQNGEIYERNL